MRARLSKWAKVRLAEPEYAALAARAGMRGLTVSAYLREAVTVDRAQFDAREAVLGLEARLRGDLGANRGDSEPLALETLLIARELLALREPQAMMRVRAQLEARYPGRVWP
jgi:hypothetical protein